MTILKIAIDSRFLQRGRPHQDVEVVEVRKCQQRLHLIGGHCAMFQITPDAVVTRTCRMANVGRNVVPKATGADGFPVSDAGESLAFSHAREICDASTG